MLTDRVMGYRRVPDPPAKMMPRVFTDSQSKRVGTAAGIEEIVRTDDSRDPVQVTADRAVRRAAGNLSHAAKQQDLGPPASTTRQQNWGQTPFKRKWSLTPIDD